MVVALTAPVAKLPVAVVVAQASVVAIRNTVAWPAARGLKSALKSAFPLPMAHGKFSRPYPIARCTQGFSPGTRARRTATFTNHALLLRKRMRR